MAYDALSLSVLVKEFNELLIGGKINKVFMPEKDEIVVNLFNKKNYRLLFSCNNNVNRVHLTEYFGENPLSAPAFCMLLRKYLVGGSIARIWQQSFERVVDFLITTKNELGYAFDVHLIFELTGRDSNLILTDENYKIFDSLRRFGCDTTLAKVVLPGATYKFFAPQQKLLPTDFNKINEEAQTSSDLRQFFNDRIQGICNATAIELFVLSGENKSNAATAMQKYLDNLSHPKPNILIVNETPNEVFPFDYISIRGKKEFFDTLNQAHDAFFYRKNKTQRFAEKSKGVHQSLKNAIARTEKKLGLQRQALLDAQQNTTNKLYGDLLLSNLYNIKNNSESFCAVNYFEEDCPSVVIPLDKRLTAKQNAQEYYKKYAKQKSSLKYNTKLVEENTLVLDYLRSVAQTLHFCSTHEDLAEITEELTDAGVIKNKQKQNIKGKKAVQKTINPLCFDIEGYSVYVGKNNIQNDFVTFKIARPTDLWFHAQNIHSSHAVIIKKDEKNIPESVIKTTAEIVASYSQASMGTKLAIDYTQRKHVKKPNGANKGFVVYTDFLTIIVNPCRHEQLLCLKK